MSEELKHLFPKDIIEAIDKMIDKGEYKETTFSMARQGGKTLLRTYIEMRLIEKGYKKSEEDDDR